MNNVKQSAYDDDVLSKIQSSWFLYKKENKVSQAQAAKQLGMKQSAFSQYLCGNIALNTDFISRFAQMVNRPPAYFHHRLEHGGEEWYSLDATIFTSEVKQTLSQGKVSNPFIIMPRMATIRDYVTVEIDNYDTRYKKGTIVFFTPIGNICESDEVGIFGKNGQIIAIGELEYCNDSWRVAVLQNGIPTKIILNSNCKLMRLEGSVQHAKNKKRIFHGKE
ncbi:helix-turn-helix domain-containing protein [Psychromonas aquimarina]|uniref:helix-turn-helix domain-containing protein n=1 Tax=Psychromonas aquimarina TaxID=444919 RepID=UPI0004186999|nr:helix-turn-helix transcriptional regulator [Psychromonas aquimarina]